MTYRPSSSGGARRVRCRCGRTVLRQLVGQRAALDVVANADELPAAAAAALREPNRLDWCVRATKHGTDLRWADCHRRRGDCPRPHVIDHQCTAPPGPPARRRPTRTPPVSEGQLALDA
ncbi:hypothetical protein [Streptomyces seoulensis]|uniref:hypothetical protein n=1 Tax=Streptomyces seoulensis TaxID=73044 RepID=UPI001FCC9CFD|nr:hypothetical protein [Streptomyces seoulensis]BDH04869.1 hypothetical protein HEK131_20960 [Streptomyces seoulensis]